MSSFPVSDRPRRLISTLADSGDLLSRADSEALFKRVVAFTHGDGDTSVRLRSTYTTNLRWARNRPISTSGITEYSAVITRHMNGTSLDAELNLLNDATTIKQTVQQLEQRLAGMSGEWDEPLGRQSYLSPAIWSDSTYSMTIEDFSDSVRKSVDPVVDAKLAAAGYAEIGAASWAVFNTRGLDAYYATTGACYGETVRMPDGKGSGQAGEAYKEWAALDPAALSAAALRDCRNSANARAVEPGRYTAILQSTVLGHLMGQVMFWLDRELAEEFPISPYHLSRRKSKMGMRIFDERLTITSDPMDPDCGYIPFDPDGNPYRKVNWVENGVLKELAYDRRYAHDNLGTNTALPNPMSARVQGGETSIEEMIATTERGILVADSSAVWVEDAMSLTVGGVTRHGLWLIERGQVKLPIKNMWFSVSLLALFNQILQVGPAKRSLGVAIYPSDRDDPPYRDLPTRVLNDGRAPLILPAMKVKDFNFTGITDAI